MYDTRVRICIPRPDYPAGPSLLITIPAPSLRDRIRDRMSGGLILICFVFSFEPLFLPFTRRLPLWTLFPGHEYGANKRFRVQTR